MVFMSAFLLRKPEAMCKDYKKSLLKTKTTAARICEPWNMRGEVGKCNESSAKYNKNKDAT